MSAAEERLREIFRNPPADAPRGPDCPPSDRSLEAVLGQVSAEEREAFAAHAATCAACAAEWRLALEFAGPNVARGSSGMWRWIAAAAASVGVLALVAVFFPRPPERGSDPPLRESAGHAVASLVPDESSLPRGSFRLRWEPLGPGFRYDLRVFDGRLRLVHEATNLAEPEGTVPVEALSAVASGAVVLWQVEAIHPGGRRFPSETFRVRLGP